jgi:hypothetical protein
MRTGLLSGAALAALVGLVALGPISVGAWNTPPPEPCATSPLHASDARTNHPRQCPTTVTITKFATNPTPIAQPGGEGDSWIVVIQNTGDVDALHAHLFDTLPAGEFQVGGTLTETANGHPVQPPQFFDTGDFTVPAHGNVTITMDVHLTAPAGHTDVNVACIFAPNAPNTHVQANVPGGQGLCTSANITPQEAPTPGLPSTGFQPDSKAAD